MKDPPRITSPGEVRAQRSELVKGAARWLKLGSNAGGGLNEEEERATEIVSGMIQKWLRRWYLFGHAKGFDQK